jgi:hypothetical protein
VGVIVYLSSADDLLQFTVILYRGRHAHIMSPAVTTVSTAKKLDFKVGCSNASAFLQSLTSIDRAMQI